MTTAATMVNGFACQVCDEKLLQLVQGFELLQRITSDTKPFTTGGKLAVCMGCGAVQKIPDAAWLNEINQIYSSYQAYHIADGEEQTVMDPHTGLPKKRSVVLMQQLHGSYTFPEAARIVDIGCGDGVTLKAMSEIFPTWKLYGYELQSSKFNLLSRIPGFQQLYTGDIAAISETFNFVSMMHSLEHFTQPLKTLMQLRSKIEQKGHLFVQVCNIEENPFDILVADHLMHFSPASLSNMAAQAGFGCVTVQTDWVKKEISFFGSAENQPVPLIKSDTKKIYARVSEHVTWLSALIEHAKSTAKSSATFGIFGTANAATWLATELGDQVKFFVDEDPNRIGRTYMGKPVVAPKDIPVASTVYLALAPSLASKIAQRLQNKTWSIIEAPALKNTG